MAEKSNDHMEAYNIIRSRRQWYVWSTDQQTISINATDDFDEGIYDDMKCA